MLTLPHGQSVEADVIRDFKRVRIFPMHACIHSFTHYYCSVAFHLLIAFHKLRQLLILV